MSYDLDTAQVPLLVIRLEREQSDEGHIFALLNEPLLSTESLRQYPLVLVDLRRIYRLTTRQAALLLLLHERVLAATGTDPGVLVLDDTPVAGQFTTSLRWFAEFPWFESVEQAQVAATHPDRIPRKE